MDTLNNLKINKIAEIENINCQNNIKRRMMDLGIVKGTKIKAILKSPSGNPKAYEVRGSVIAIRNEDAKQIVIKNKALI